jgi:hypothetical protein
MTWSPSVKKTTVNLASVGSSPLPGWGPKDFEHCWLETLQDMVQSRSQRHTCFACAYVFLDKKSKKKETKNNPKRKKEIKEHAAKHVHIYISSSAWGLEGPI